MLFEFDGRTPDLSAETGYVAPNATLIGAITLGAEASVWFGAVLRGDSERIAIGAGSNVQDNSVLHTDPGFPLEVAENVTIGHMVVLHGCRIGAGSLIGMGSVIMNGAQIGRNCLVAAGSLIPEGKIFPDGSVIRGRPGTIVGPVTPEHEAMMQRASLSYRDRARRYRDALHPA
ncbi:gamma carbonic anhydrase family protein [Gluconacetobacter azotocaptans]|uniref:Gamma carbonic anhydrase family protein n=1 Tax=Gluconacetobacter azotocaptans TaxID=142834 RepID=A0A7W4PFJ1_9PROT|nr:gamma carbonic anhydrase family protein [Gluconacetobacter azotocaptans]MBB2188971.1 gamma carbonic anhydrase family protein [Gluconacetobacter azotocaptans]MBM9401457.1 gamma carbonic anhydrase family protein [Gluconacetobacter azotocaptans]GBQ25869.1 hexapeptide repeat-containing transferase [Gluconacetobacter azotocaptans DSM 13594]